MKDYNKKMDPNEYFLEIFKEKQKQSPQFSVRAAALKLNISPATLSQILNSKTKITLETADKIVTNLKIADFQKETFLLLVIKDRVKSNLMRKEIEHKVQAIKNRPTPEDSKKVSAIRNAFSSKKISTYFCREYDRLRVLNRYQNCPELSRSFSETIVCSREGVTSDVFFVPQLDSRYSIYVSIHDGSATYRDQIQFPANRSVNVEWKNGLPQIFSSLMPLIAKKEYAVVNILYSEDNLIIEGESFSYSGDSPSRKILFEHVRIS